MWTAVTIVTVVSILLYTVISVLEPLTLALPLPRTSSSRVRVPRLKSRAFVGPAWLPNRPTTTFRRNHPSETGATADNRRNRL
jgi:hypothetical protein